MIPNDEVVSWLLKSDPWTAYRTRIDILQERIDSLDREKIVHEIMNTEKIKTLINQVEEYFPKLATRHTDSKLSHYKLRMLSDFGLLRSDNLSSLVEKVESFKTNGKYAIRQQLPIKNYDQSIEWNALPCDNPVIISTLRKLGIFNESINEQIKSLAECWSVKTGWFCNLSFVNGQYKKEQIGCPMAGLVALEVFALDDDLKDSISAHNAYNSLLYHYKLGKSIYYFGRGKMFYTFKYPYVWYNALYMADILTKFDFLKKEELVIDLIKWIENGCDESGKYKPTSVFTEYKDWDFGNKKSASPWITYLCYKILGQYYN